jgi:hypothetical protein
MAGGLTGVCERSSPGTAAWLRRAALVLALAATGFVSATFHFIAYPERRELALLLLAGLWVAVLPALLGVAWLLAWRRRISTVAHCDGEGLHLGRGRGAAREAIAAALVVHRHAGSELEIDLEDGDRLHLHASDARGAEAALRDLCLAPEQRRVAIPLEPTMPPLSAVTAGIVMAAVPVAAITVPLSPIGPVAAAFFALLALVGYGLFQAAGRIAIGSDGVVVESPRGRRFLALADIAAVRHDAGMVIELTSRELVRIATPAGRGAAIVARVEAAIRAARAQRDGADLAALDRGERTAAAWRAALLGLRASSSYRDAAIPIDRIVGTAADDRAPPARRIAAALVASTDSTASARVRIATDTLANDALRVAMQRALDGDLDEAAIAEAERVSSSARAESPSTS